MLLLQAMKKEIVLKAKDFADELTYHNVIEKGLTDQQSIYKEHTNNNKAVRDMLLQRGIKAEVLQNRGKKRNSE